MNSDTERLSPEELRAAVDRTRPEDFDGHREWDELSLADKLRWMAAAARFVLSQRERDRRGAPDDSSRSARRRDPRG